MQGGHPVSTKYFGGILLWGGGCGHGKLSRIVILDRKSFFGEKNGRNVFWGGRKMAKSFFEGRKMGAPCLSSLLQPCFGHLERWLLVGDRLFDALYVALHVNYLLQEGETGRE